MKRILLFSIALLFIGEFCPAQDKSSNTLLWRIDSKTGEKPSYLFGTVHIPQKEFVVYTDSVYTAIQNTGMFYNEIDFLNQSFYQDTSLISFFTEKGKHFDSLQKTEGWKRLIDKINRKYNTHINRDNIDEFLAFAQKSMAPSYKTDPGMSLPDMMLAEHAVSLGKKTGGLETFRLQFGMIYDVLDACISDTTMELNDNAVLTDNLKRFYVNQQLDSTTKLLGLINPTYRELIFDRRNKTMTDSIIKHSAEIPSFFAVGTGHLCGPTGIIELLRKRGFTLTPVHSGNKISLLVINNMLKQSKKSVVGGEELEDVKIDVMQEGVKEEIPPPPPPAPPKIEMKKAPASKQPKKDPKKKP